MFGQGLNLQSFHINVQVNEKAIILSVLLFKYQVKEKNVPEALLFDIFGIAQLRFKLVFRI